VRLGETPRTPGKKRVVFEDPIGGYQPGDGTPPRAAVVFGTVTLRNSTNITHEPLALKR
jgi:hypothetical protein